MLNIIKLVVFSILILSIVFICYEIYLKAHNNDDIEDDFGYLAELGGDNDDSTY